MQATQAPKSSGCEATQNCCLDATAITYEWEDVTTAFKGETSRMTIGQLVHDDTFSLFDAMSALELMDPKMDAGMFRHKRREVLDFETAKQNGFIKLRNLDYREILTVIDASLSCWTAWNEGHSLAQTVFVNLYFHKPFEIEHPVLKAFCLSMLKLIDLCRAIIQKAAVFEEEDYQGLSYGFEMCVNLSDQRVVGMLKEAEDELHHAMKKSQKENQADDLAVIEGVLARIRFVKHLFISIYIISLQDTVKTVLPATASTLKSDNMLDEAAKMLQTCEYTLAKIQETMRFGTAFNEESDGALADFPFIDVMANQRLLPPTFPRQTKLMSRSSALEYLQCLICRLKQVALLPVGGGSFDVVLDYFRDFTLKQSCVLSRSLMQLGYMPDGHKSHIAEQIRESMRIFCFPPSLLAKSFLTENENEKKIVDDFTNLCLRVGLSFLHISGYNRARQREKMMIMLEELAHVQAEAEKADEHFHLLLNEAKSPLIHFACYGSYILYHVLMLMTKYLLLNIELELYSPCEYVWVYWYLSGVLYKWIIDVLQRAEATSARNEPILMKMDKSKSDKKKKVKPKRNASKGHQTEIQQWVAYQKLTEAYYRAMLSLQIAKKIRDPEYAAAGTQIPFAAIRYEHRFLPFAFISTPPFLNYMQFLEISGLPDALRSLSLEKSCADAVRTFEDARAMFDEFPSTIAEVQTVMKLCKMNAIVFRLLSTGRGADADESVQFDFSLHACFPLIKIAK